ncbi:Polyubiquitin [Diplonema papillatum]|nr:Polyubiquitin [Diplonema papillatum]
MTTWTIDVYEAKSVQGSRLSAMDQRSTCNPMVTVEFGGEKLCSTSQQSNTRDPKWNERLRGESKEGLAKRLPLVFRVQHKPIWGGAESVRTVSFARVFVSPDNAKEPKKRLQLLSNYSQEENGGWIDIAWTAVDHTEKRDREDAEARAKAAMLKSMTPPATTGASPPEPITSKLASPAKKLTVGDKILARDDDGPWRSGIVQEVDAEGLPKIKLEKAKDKDKDTAAKPDEKPADGKPEAKDEAPKVDGKASTVDAAAQAIHAAKLSPNQAHQLALLQQQVGLVPSAVDTELAALVRKKDEAVAAERFLDAQQLKEQIDGYKSLVEQRQGGWRSEAPVASLVRSLRRIEFESGKCIEAGTIGELIGGLVRMGTALFTPAPGDVENYAAAYPSAATGPGSSSSLPPGAITRKQALAATLPAQTGQQQQQQQLDLLYPPHASTMHGSSTVANRAAYTSVARQAPPQRGGHPHNGGGEYMLVIVPQYEMTDGSPAVEFVVRNVAQHDLVAAIKQRLQAISGVPATQQSLAQLLPDGRRQLLDDRRTLASYFVSSGDSLMLTRTAGVTHVSVVIEGRHRARLALPHGSTVLSLKQRILHKENVPVSLQTLEYEGEILHDSKPLSYYGIAGPEPAIRLYQEQLRATPAAAPAGISRRRGDLIKITVLDETDASERRSITMDCLASEQVSSIKQRLAQQGGLPHAMVLTFEGAELGDAYELQEYCVADGAILVAQSKGRTSSPALKTSAARSDSPGLGIVSGGPPQQSEDVTVLQSQVAVMSKQVQTLSQCLENLLHSQQQQHQQQHGDSAGQKVMLDPRTQNSTAALLSDSRALRQAAENEVARVVTLSEPVNRSPRRSSYLLPAVPDITSTGRFQQMKKIAQEHAAVARR